jgi:long-chain acyl-CoA synthetase
MHAVDMIFYWARAVPHRPAIVQSEMVTTFQGLANAIESVSERIDRLNINKREAVAVSIANPSFMLATCLAVLRSGYSVAPVNAPLYPYLQGAGIRNLIYDTEGLAVGGGRNIRFEMSWVAAAATANRVPYRHRPVGDVNTLLFTSGSTGVPRVEAVSGAALAYRFAGPLSSCASGDHRKALILPGLAGGFGFNRACEMLYAGKAACFAPSDVASLALIDTFQIDAIVASPQQAVGLAALQESKPQYSLASLKTLRVGGAVISREMGRKLRTYLCRDIIVSYASTEAGTAATAPYDVIENIPNAVGILCPDAELEIVDEAGALLPPGSEGQIRVRTPQLLLNQKAAQAVDRNAWFYPGDLGTLNEDRVLCITGRSTDVINSGGIKVSSTRIEEALQSLPLVKEAGACGIVGPNGIEEVWIAVVTEGPVDVAAIKQHLRGHKNVRLEPREVFVVDQIPRGDLGKIQRARLREQLLALKKGG